MKNREKTSVASITIPLIANTNNQPHSLRATHPLATAAVASPKTNTE